MKKKPFKILIIILLIVYLPFAPIFLNSNYGSQPQSIIPTGDSHAYLWLTRNDSLIHLIVVGFWNYEIQKRTNLLFRDEKGLLSKLIINSSNYIIDEKEFDAPELKNKVIEMNSGPSNMYGGIGSTGIISLKLPVIPEKHVELILKGEAINIQNQKQPFSISVKSEIITRSETIPFYKYFYWKLTAT